MGSDVVEQEENSGCGKMALGNSDSNRGCCLGEPSGRGDVAWWELRKLGEGGGRGETSGAVAAEELEKQQLQLQQERGDTGDPENGGWRTKQGS